MKSATDKLEFLETYAFQNTDIVGMKQRSKALILQRQNELTSSKTKLEMSSVNLERMEQPAKEIKFPLKGSNIELMTRNQRIKSKNTSVLISRTQKQITALQKELGDANVLDEFKTNKKLHLDDLTKRINSMTNNVEYIGDVALRSLEIQFEYLTCSSNIELWNETLETHTRNLNSLVEKEKQSLTEQICKLDGDIWQDGDEDTTAESIEMFKTILDDIKKLKRLRDRQQTLCKDSNDITAETLRKEELKIANVKETISTVEVELVRLAKLSDMAILECPSCEAPLQLKNNILSLVKDEGHVEKNTDKHEIKKLRDDAKSKLKKLGEELNQLQAKYVEHKTAFATARGYLDKVEKEIHDIAEQYETGLDELEQEPDDVKDGTITFTFNIK
jgi:hypothetical protein